MNILLYDIGSYTQNDLIYYLEKAGYHCRNILYPQTDLYHDPFFERKFTEQLNKAAYDFVMSTNFSPIVAKVCFHKKIKYISWTYDSPINTDHIEYYQFPTSYIFLFDRIEAERVLALGGKNIYHLPLAVNPDRTGKLTITDDDISRYSADISFIGNFYEGPMQELMAPQDDYDRGYIDALVNIQFKIYGYNFIEDLITEDLVARMNRCLAAHGYHVTGLTKRGLIHSIAKSITHKERLILLNMLGRSHNVHYYSLEQPELLSHLTFKGTAHYYTEMPKIFHLSKLNLNPTLKSIQSGITLRALDILCCGGVLLSNYQPELAEYFVDGQDVLMYESIEDALYKADYYLKHENERIQIAQNGYQKVITHFSYPERIAVMLKTAGII